MSYTTVPKSLKLKVFKRDQWSCWYCGRDFTGTNYEIDLWPIPSTIKNIPVPDHVLPLSKGGKSTLENLVTSCWACNNEKRQRTLEQYRHYLRKSILAYQAKIALIEAINDSTGTMPEYVKKTLAWLDGQIPEIKFWGESHHAAD